MLLGASSQDVSLMTSLGLVWLRVCPGRSIIKEVEEQVKIYIITMLCHGQYNSFENELLTAEILFV